MEVVSLKKHHLGYLFVIISAFGLSLFPVLSTIYIRNGVLVSQIQLYKYLFATIFLLLYVITVKIKFNLNKKDYLLTFLMGGVCSTVISVCYLEAMKYISPAIASFVLYIYPIFTCAYSVVFEKGNITRKTYLSIILSLIGLFMLLNVLSGKINILGLLLAFVAAISYSIYVIAGSKISQSVNSTASGFLVIIFTMIGLCIVYYTSSNTYQTQFNTQLFEFTCISGIFCTAIPILLFLKGMSIIGPINSSIISTSDTLFTTILSAIILKDSLAVSQAFGGLIFITGIILLIISREKHVKNKEIFEN